MLAIRFHGRGGQGVKTAQPDCRNRRVLEGFRAQDSPFMEPTRGNRHPTGPGTGQAILAAVSTGSSGIRKLNKSHVRSTYFREPCTAPGCGGLEALRLAARYWVTIRVDRSDRCNSTHSSEGRRLLGSSQRMTMDAESAMKITMSLCNCNGPCDSSWRLLCLSRRGTAVLRESVSRITSQVSMRTLMPVEIRT